MGEQTESRETMEVTTPTVKEDRKISWGPNEGREYHEEEGNKDIATRRQVEDDVNMVVDDGGNIDEGWRDIPLKERLGYKKMPLQKDVKKKAGKQ